MLAVRLPEDLEYELNRYARSLHKTKTDIVKDALALFFKAQSESSKKTPYELGESLFGRFQSGRDDLSSTYKKKLKEKLNEKYDTDR